MTLYALFIPSPQVRRVACTLGVWMTAAWPFSSGCNMLPHKEAKVQASQRWQLVRAGIKQKLAGQQFGAGRFDEAIRTAGEAMALDPKSAAAYELLARCYLESGKAASAAEALRTAASRGVESPGLHYTRGILYEQQGRFDEARAAYDAALQLEPGNADYLMAKAECLAAAGRTDEARILLNDETRRVDDDGTVAMLRAQMAALDGDDEEAVRLLREVRRRDPENAFALAELGRRLARAGHCAEAISVLEPLVSRPGEVEPGGSVRRALAGCYLGFEDFASAQAVITPLAQTHPTDTIAQLLLAKAALGLNDMLTAMRAIDLAARHGGDQPEVKFVRAAILWKRGRLEAAADELRAVIAAKPADADAHCLLGAVLNAQHNTDAARTQFQLALELEPDSAWASAGLEAAERAETTKRVTLPPH